MTRKNLVIVRAGKNTLHANWLAASEPRNWDLIVSLYDDVPYQALVDEEVIRIKGGKFDGLYKTIASFDDLLATYEYVWLPDDDILTSQGDINRLFDFMSEYDLAVAQPSLSWESYFSFLLTMNAPCFTLRYVTMIETMVPCLRNDVLKAALPSFEDNMTLWGMDVIWCRLQDDNFRKAAIIDAIKVFHTRPIGQVLASKATASGHDTVEAMHKLLERFGVKEPFANMLRSYDAIYANGDRPRSEFTQQLVWFFDMAKFLFCAKHNDIKINKILNRLRKLIAVNFNRKSNLTKLLDGEALKRV